MALQGVAAVAAAKTHCGKNHPLSGANLSVVRGKRVCRACQRETSNRYRERVLGPRPGVTPRGEDHGNAKLTEAAVRVIRSSSASQRELAATFGVSRTEIAYVQKRVVWRHI